jgi:signal transduction histidine kinase
LYIIKRIVENNGGNITVESEEGKGTKFLIAFREQLSVNSYQ